MLGSIVWLMNLSMIAPAIDWTSSFLHIALDVGETVKLQRPRAAICRWMLVWNKDGANKGPDIVSGMERILACHHFITYHRYLYHYHCRFHYQSHCNDHKYSAKSVYSVKVVTKEVKAHRRATVSIGSNGNHVSAADSNTCISLSKWKHTQKRKECNIFGVPKCLPISHMKLDDYKSWSQAL